MFPLVTGAEFQALVESIATLGLEDPIAITPDGLILDGRNRYNACLAAGVEPRTTIVHADPVPYVIIKNIRRRNLNESQRAMVAARLVDTEHGGDRRSSQAATVPHTTQADAAGQLNISERSVRSAVAVRRIAEPAVIQAVESGLLPVHQAAGLAKRSPDVQRAVVEKLLAGAKPTEAVRQVQRDGLADRVATFPVGTYRVLYADPPWQYSDARATGDHRQSTAAATHYPTMSVTDISAMRADVDVLSQRDAVLFMWATFPLLPDALQVVAAWGFQYKTAFVWAKGRGSFGHYHKADAELLLVATRGSCVPDSEHRETQVQAHARGRHSEKPEAFRSLVDCLYPIGPRIELFARGTLPVGWVGWGNEYE
jgi:N6-adenosine-specific RNA methylase IME4